MRIRWLLSVLAFLLPLAARAAETYEVPYRLADTKHILVRAKLNGQGPFTFILDTGAPALYLTKSVGQKLGAKEDKRGWVTLDRLEIEGGAVVPKARARVEDLAPVEAINGLGLAGTEVHGLMGYHVLARFRIELDLTRDKMKWTALDYEPPPPRVGGKGAMPGSINALGAVMKLVGALLGKKANRDVSPRGFLGIELAEVEGAVEVAKVLARSPAAADGLRAGDRVVRFQGKAVKGRAALQQLAAGVAPGAEVKIIVRRSGRETEVGIRAGEGL
jgi:hypothetical protein